MVKREQERGEVDERASLARALGQRKARVSLEIDDDQPSARPQNLPDVKIAWQDVWLGAAVTSLFFTVGKFLIGLYLGKSAVASAYGAAGSLVIIVVWVYYSAQILLFGAEFTKVWTKRRGSGFTLEKTAKPVTAEARAEQGLGPKRSA